MIEGASFSLAHWPAPPHVVCLVTTRNGGHSNGPYRSFNLARHVGDNPEHVAANRSKLQRHLGPLTVLNWMRQVHGASVAGTGGTGEGDGVPQADAMYTAAANQACCILTADCLPVCFSNRAGTEVAVAHAGWRGLVSGVLENTLAGFSSPPADILAWLGPAIGPCHFEVGDEVRVAFMQAGEKLGVDMSCGFARAGAPGKWMGNLFSLARIRLLAAGVAGVHGGGTCTYCEQTRFYSYRRDGRTGRFATLIYLSGA